DSGRFNGRSRESESDTPPSQSFGGTDQSGLYADRPGSSSTFGTDASTTASPTSAPASSGTSPNRDYRTSPDGDPFGVSGERGNSIEGGDCIERSASGELGEDEDRSRETPESEAARGPREGDLRRARPKAIWRHGPPI